MGKVIEIPRKVGKPGKKHSGQVYAYLRVSTEAQDLTSQKLGLLNYARDRGFGINGWCDETASGALAASKRDLGQKLLPKLQAGDILLVSELSRLGRSTADVLATLQELADRSVEVHVAKGGFQIDQSINSKILATVLGLAAEIERELIRQRTKEGQARAKASGKHIGRPRLTDDQQRRSKLDARASEIKKLAERGVTKLNLARVFECDWSTMDLWLRRHGIRVQKTI